MKNCTNCEHIEVCKYIKDLRLPVQCIHYKKVEETAAAKQQEK